MLDTNKVSQSANASTLSTGKSVQDAITLSIVSCPFTIKINPGAVNPFKTKWHTAIPGCRHGNYHNWTYIKANCISKWANFTTVHHTNNACVHIRGLRSVFNCPPPSSPSSPPFKLHLNLLICETWGPRGGNSLNIIHPMMRWITIIPFGN